MAEVIRQRNIAYRCPDCGSAAIGLIGKFALHSGMLRLKCGCPEANALDVIPAADNKVKLSVPCLLCRQNHAFTVSEQLFFDRESLGLSCPYSGIDIAFIGGEEEINSQLSRTEQELNALMAGLEAEELSDIQPQEMQEGEILPDPAVYDTIRFLVKDLESDGCVKCPCGDGEYDLRFIEGGVQIYCEKCGATKDIPATSVTIAEEYLGLDEIILK